MSKADLREAAGFAPNTMTKLRKYEPVAIDKICETLNTDYGDIMQYTPDGDEKFVCLAFSCDLLYQNMY